MIYNRIIRFDWAIKRLLRDSVNFVILEGFLSELLQDDIIIHRVLECEDDKKDESCKFNRINVLAENSEKEQIIIEVHNTRELYYFERMLYGVSKAITEYIHERNLYSEVQKVYTVNIVYLNFGQGSDYIYKGETQFKGLHTGDTLCLSPKQRNIFFKEDVGDIPHEYYVLRVNEFNDEVKTSLDEWICFLKSGVIDEQSKAKGLQAARQRLKVANMSEQEQRAYEHHMDNIRVQWDVLTTAYEEGKDKGRVEGMQKIIEEGVSIGMQKERIEIAKRLLEKGLSLELVVEYTCLPVEELKKN